MAGKRNRLLIGRLVASTNRLTSIQSKHLDIKVLYKHQGLHNQIIAKSIIGVRYIGR